jgi:ribose/xylose/arabinose/galactoside ABC-type transport system permease subunit
VLTFRTKLLLTLIIALGLGIGILSGLHDGLYSAACLFVLPIVVTLAGGSIFADLGKEQERRTESLQTERHHEDINWPHAA